MKNKIKILKKANMEKWKSVLNITFLDNHDFMILF